MQKKRTNSSSTSSKRTLTVMESRDENIYMVEGFEEAAKRKGWEFYRLKEINSDKISRFDFDDIPLDYSIMRCLSNNYYEIDRILSWMEKNGKICLNGNIAGARMSTSDKHFQQGLFMLDPFLKKYALPTYEAKNKANVKAYLKAGRVHYPIALKTRYGTTAVGIYYAESDADLDEIDSFSDLLIEQYINLESDFRVFVIGGVAVGTLRKVGNTGDPRDFKSWNSGRDKYTETDPEVIDLLSEIATRAAAISRLGYAGIDIIREQDSNNYYLLETNIAAGWPNFTPVTHIDIPGLTIDWMQEIADGRDMSFAKAVEKYLENRRKYLPGRIQKSCSDIMNGVKKATEPYRKIFSNYPNKYLYDAGKIFERLNKAYNEITNNPESYFDIQPEKITEIRNLIREIESMPFSWAGNFVGPEVGTLHDGAILSSLYLFLRHKVKS